MIVTVTLNPALDKTVTLPGFAVNTVNRVQSIRLDPGGKGINVSKTVHSLSGKTLAICVLGGATGGYIKASLDELGIPNDVVLSADTTRTNLKIVDPVLRTNTDINEAGFPLTQETLQQVWDKICKTVQSGDTVVFAGKNPPGMADDQLALWTRKLKTMGVRVCVDTVGEPMLLAIREKPDIIKPNRTELSELLGRQIRTDEEVLQAAREILDMGVSLVVVSLGGDGAVFVTQKQQLRGYSPKVNVGSTVGAGDSMMAALAHYSAAGCSLEEIARRAVAVSAANVTMTGSQAPELTDILPLIERVRIETI